jgi:multidrug resistance efflux pump
MNQEPAATDPQPVAAVEQGAVVEPGGHGSRVGAGVLVALILTSLVLYFVGDRLTPYTSQARLQAFVVPVAAEVSGQVLQVHIHDNDFVEKGAPLFDVDPEQYRIALQRARSDYASVGQSVNASVAGVDSARASLNAAKAGREMAEKDASRQERLHAEDPGAISVRRLEIAQSTREEARSKEKRAEADLRKAVEAAGESGDDNAQLQSARAAVEKRNSISREPGSSPRREAP